MSIFKINIKPIVKEKEWDVKYIRSGRTEKQCANCGRKIQIGQSSTTFTKITAKGEKRSFQTLHACGGSPVNSCTIGVFIKLKIPLP